MESKSESKDWVISWVLIHQMVFVVTGLLKTIGNQQMAYIGIDVGWVLLNAGISTIGPILIPIWLRGVRGLGPSDRELSTALIAAFLDAVGMVCSVLGMKYAGSGLMSVIYASLPACTAVLRFFWMGKSISHARILYMLGVMAGLAMVPLYEGLNFGEGSATLMLGLGMSFASTFVYGVLYVHVERSMSAEGLQASCDPMKLIFWQAILACLFLYAGYILWSMLVDPDILVVSDPNGPSVFMQLLLPGLLLVCSSATHAFSWTKLLESQGSTGTGLLQAVRSSLSVLISAALFCDLHPTQCLTVMKVMSAVVVLAFVGLFNRAK